METAKVSLIYGTEESAFECWEDKFNTKEEAEKEAKDFLELGEEQGYEVYAKVCETTAEKRAARAELKSLRKEWLDYYAS